MIFFNGSWLSCSWSFNRIGLKHRLITVPFHFVRYLRGEQCVQNLRNIDIIISNNYFCYKVKTSSIILNAQLPDDFFVCFQFHIRTSYCVLRIFIILPQWLTQFWMKTMKKGQFSNIWTSRIHSIVLLPNVYIFIMYLFCQLLCN